MVFAEGKLHLLLLQIHMRYDYISFNIWFVDKDQGIHHVVTTVIMYFILNRILVGGTGQVSIINDSAFLRSKHKSLITHKVEPIQVVDVSVLPPIGMDHIFVHGDLRAVEHWRLVHVVPCEQVRAAAIVAVVGEATGPPVTHILTSEIWVAGWTWRKAGNIKNQPCNKTRRCSHNSFSYIRPENMKLPWLGGEDLGLSN